MKKSTFSALKFKSQKALLQVLLTHDKEREDPLQHGDDLQLFLYFGFG